MSDTLTGNDSRRDFLKKAAIGGTAAVWAPPLVDSVVSGASAAQTGTGKCYKYMWNTVYADDAQICVDPGNATGKISSQYYQTEDAAGQAEDQDHIGQVQTNPNCCQDRSNYHPPVPAGNDAQWNDLDDITGCITVTGNTTGVSGGGNSITFTNTCTDCYMADITVVTAKEEAVNPGPVDCSNFSPSSTGGGSSVFTNQFVVTWTSDKVPVWFKIWFACDLSICSPQIVPCTQSACLPGPEGSNCGGNTPDPGKPCTSLTVAAS